jgi:hypothetical protein
MDHDAQIFNHIRRNVLMAEDKTFLMVHNEKWQKPIPSDIEKGIQGGYFASLRLEWIVGFVKIISKYNGKYDIIFGRNPFKWTEVLRLEDIEEQHVVKALLAYDNKHQAVHVAGAITTNKVKRRGKITPIKGNE